MAVHLTKRRFTVSEYHRMAEAGILGEDDRVELIEGEVAEMTPIGLRHAACVNRLTDLFGMFRDVAILSVQNPVGLTEFDEPQPDLALLRRKGDYYVSQRPTPADILLLIEVCETSAEPDRRVKVPLYAGSGISEVWLVNIEQETITVYTEPSANSYRSARVVHRSERIAPAAFPDRFLSVDDILG